MVHFSKIISSVKEKINNLQMIAVSVKWTNGMHTFISLLFFKWQYIFGSHLEAARFMNVRFSVVQVENNKLEKITGIVYTTIALEVFFVSLILLFYVFREFEA